MKLRFFWDVVQVSVGRPLGKKEEDSYVQIGNVPHIYQRLDYKLTATPSKSSTGSSLLEDSIVPRFVYRHAPNKNILNTKRRSERIIIHRTARLGSPADCPILDLRMPVDPHRVRVHRDDGGL